MYRRYFQAVLLLAIVLVTVFLSLTISRESRAVFEPDPQAGLLWTYEEQRLRPMLIGGDIDSDSIRFGASIQMNDHTLVASDPEHMDGSGASYLNNPGVVYIYDSDGNGGWILNTRIAAPEGYRFWGRGLALDDTTLLIRASLKHTSPPASLGHHIFVYVKENGQWLQQAVITAPDSGDTEHLFGASVLLEGDTAVITRQAGAVYIYRRIGTEWAFVQTLPDAISPNRNTIVMSGSRIAVAEDRHTVKIYENSGDTWALADTIAVPSSGTYGIAPYLALQDDRLALGIPYYDYVEGNVTRTDVGTVALYRYQSDSWVLEDMLFDREYLSPNHNLGMGVQMDDDIIVANTAYYGAIFVEHEGLWTPANVFNIKSGDTIAVHGQYFAFSESSASHKQYISLSTYAGFWTDGPLDKSPQVEIGEPYTQTLTLATPVNGQVMVGISASGCLLNGLEQDLIWQPLTNESPSFSFTATIPESNPTSACFVRVETDHALTDDLKYILYPRLLFTLSTDGEPRPTLTATNSTPRPTSETQVPTTAPTLVPTYTDTHLPTAIVNPCTPMPTRTPIDYELTLVGGGDGRSSGDPCASTVTPVSETPPPTALPTIEPTAIVNPCTVTVTRTPLSYTLTPGGGGDGRSADPCTATPTAMPSPLLEPTPTSSARIPTQLIRNAEFDRVDPLAQWMVSYVPAARPDDRPQRDGVLNTFFFKGGAGENSQIWQVIKPSADLNFRAGDSLVLDVIYRDTAFPSDMRVKIVVKYRGSNPQQTTIMRIQENSAIYRSSSSTITLQSAEVKKIKVTVINASQSKKSKIFIDSVGLWWMPLP